LELGYSECKKLELELSLTPCLAQSR